MKPLKHDGIRIYIKNNIDSFHSNRLLKLNKLKLSKILKKKNPYLFKAKNLLTAHDLVKSLLDSYLSSQEETTFGNFLEGLAIFINEMVYGGKKSAAEGIDLEFDNDNIHYIISIKSGPNWGNSSQVKKMKDNFKKAKTILRTNNNKMQIIAINGCCYGKNKKYDKGEYFKYCGEIFWTFVSGDDHLFIDIIEPLGHKAKEKSGSFNRSYAQIINLFTQSFSEDYCNDGIIDWEKLIRFNSSAYR